VKGLITYASVGAQKLLGYMPQEMIGRMMITQTVDTGDLLHRSLEIESETGKVLPADFTVMSFKTIFTRGNEETRVWNMMKKDRSMASVRLTARPLNDDGGVFGFVFYGKEIQEAVAPTANSPVHA
jgi:PAS domain-containing protein